eukprot:484384_1
MSLWECKHCGLYNYPVEKQCKACFYYQYNRIEIIKKQNKYEYYYQRPLDMIPKRPLIAELTVYGYIRIHKYFCPNEIIKMIYNFYFITIFSYKIKTNGRYDYGQGIGNDEDVETLKTLRTHQKPIKNII